jgi:protein TonB
VRCSIDQAASQDAPAEASLDAPAVQAWSPVRERSAEQSGQSLGEARSAGADIRPEPVAPPPRVGTDRGRRWIGTGVAVILHAGSLVALGLAAPAEPSGGGGEMLEAISVEIIVASAVESRAAPAEQAMAAANAPVAPEEGDRMPDADRSTKPEPKPEEPEPQPEPQPEPATHDVALAEQVAPPEPAPPEPALPEPIPPKAEPEKTEAEKPEPAEPNRSGGVAALGVAPVASGTARASASPGMVQRYAMQVRTALARNKPDGRGRRGTATVTFAISAAGKLSFARLTAPSGNALLDKAALAAVQRTSFPPPPEGMSETQLTYVIPFHFK